MGWAVGFVSFIGFILLTKLLSCNDAVLNMDTVLLKSLQIFRVYFSHMESALLWQVLMSQALGK
jgi:hypothetical protein